MRNNGSDGVWWTWSGIRSAVHVSRIGTDLLAWSDSSGPPPDDDPHHSLQIYYDFRMPSLNLHAVRFEVYSSCPAGHIGAGLGFWVGYVEPTGCSPGWHSFSSDWSDYDDNTPDSPTMTALVVLHGWDLSGIRISKARLVWTDAP